MRALIVDARSHLDSALTLWRQYVDERAQGATKAWRRTRKNAQTHLAEARRRWRRARSIVLDARGVAMS